MVPATQLLGHRLFGFQPFPDSDVARVGCYGPLMKIVVNSVVVLAAAAIGLGLVQAPSFVAGERIRTGQLIPVLADHEADPMALWAVYTTGRHLAGKVRVMVDFLVSHFQDSPPWDQGW